MPHDRPNILLLFTDQQRFDTIAALGNPVIRTPNLDRLFRDGVAFTSAYSPSPVCVPARCSLHYGQYPWRTECYENWHAMPQDRPSFVDVLREQGYRTHGIGKCHFTPDAYALRGFQTRETQEEIVADPQRDDYLRWLFDQGFGHLCDPHGVRGEMYYVPQPAQMPARLHPSQWVGDRSVAFLQDRPASEPWFLFSSFVHPHPPFAPPAPWHKLYRAPLMPLPNLPPESEALHTYINRRQNRYKYRDQGSDTNLIRSLRAYYYACISFVDHQVGRILDALQQNGQIDRTLILFTSDHGELLGDYGCFGKRSMHDACARVPLLARLPGRFDGGRQCDRVTSLVDIAPTVLSAASADRAGLTLDGQDLAEVLNAAAARDAVYAQHDSGERALYTLVTDQWKYAYSAPDGREYLFDRRGDPCETRNRAGLVFCQETLAALRQRMFATLQSYGCTENVAGDRWKPTPVLELDPDPDAGLLIQDHAWADQRIPGYSC